MLSQQNRIGRLTTPLGADILCLVELSASEGLSQLFDFDIVAASEDANVDFDSLIGQPCAVEVEADAAGKRWFHGLLTEGEWNEEVEGLSYYRLRLQPWCWLLTKTADCRIHHDKTVVDIIRDTFADHGLSAYKSLLTQSYPTLHYTVQYCETDWNFVCRLMELHGIYYFFEHEAGQHTLVLADGYPAHAAEGPARPIQFNASTAAALDAMRTPYVSRWSQRRRLRTGKFEITDFNHLIPTASQLANRPNPHAYANGQFEVFDWPGPHVNRDEGEAYVKVRAEAEEALDKRRLAAGVAAAIFPGALASLSRHPRDAENGEYVTVGMQSRLGPQNYRGDASSGEGGFTAEYEFQPSSLQYRAPFATPKPLVNSLQTATVVGQEGEEIDCDDHGRILVHFFWDRHGDQSCRVRVNQVWGGQTWGAQVIPRIGMEVMVAYIDGDPDRPIVVGSVPNPKTLPTPYELPAKKTKMAWRSKTNKASGFNEMTFEDDNGVQNLFMHAEKDRTEKTRNNHTHRVDANSLQSIGANHSLQIANNMSHQVGGGVSQIIGLPPDAVSAVDAAPASLLNTDSGAGMAGGGAGLAQTVAGMVGQGVLNQLITKFHNTTTGIAKVEDIGVSDTLNVGATKDDTIGKHYKIVVGDTFEIIVGKSRFFMDKDGNISVIGVRHTHVASGPIQMNGQVIDLNP
jgi:type VI secretion system secreted protein VgrG